MARSTMAKVIRVEIVLHNMIVEHRRKGYYGVLFQGSALNSGSFIDQ